MHEKTGGYFGVSIRSLLLSRLDQVAKKQVERDILVEFLTGDVLSEIEEASRTETKSLQSFSCTEDEVFLFQRERIKASGLYESEITRRMGVVDDISQIPGRHKQFQGEVDRIIKDNISQENVTDYYVFKRSLAAIQRIARNLFYAINHNLDKDKTLKFIRAVYELDKIRTSETIGDISALLSTAISTGQPVELLHIKSIRFTYPNGDRLQVIEDTDKISQPTREGGSRTYPTEEVIFERLNNIARTIEQFGVSVNLTIIVSDHDLEYCFPPQQQIVPGEDVLLARESIARYVQYLRQHHPEFKNIYTLTEYLELSDAQNAYHKLFSMLVFQGKGGGGQHVPGKILEMRVNGQFEHYSEMFPRYTRKLARHTAICQIANVMALSAVFDTFPATPLLVIDSRGFEDQLIGGYNPASVVKFFTKLKDPVVKC